ncbi:MAG: AAA family ATPase [Symbiobacteriia bacterium]
MAQTVELTQARELAQAVQQNIQQVMVGKTREIQYVLVALLAGGHVLVEDVPGVGKTTLVRALARSLGCRFQRLQFTPDLLPSDVTGVAVYNPQQGQFTFREGPIFSQILLADEINRTSPKTQSALLESMEEGQATVDGVSHQLPRPFLVLATENPIEYEGTFPLPEAQLDRFLIRLKLGYPSLEEERLIVQRSRLRPLEQLTTVAAAEDVLAAQEMVAQVHLDPSLEDYTVRLVHKTRQHPDVYLGGSPRGSIALARSAQALALIRGRDYVTPDDIKEMAPLTLCHRVLLKPEARLNGTTPEKVLADVIAQVPVPVESGHGR